MQGRDSNLGLHGVTRMKAKKGEEALKKFQIQLQEKTVAISLTDNGDWERSQN